MSSMNLVIDADKLMEALIRQPTKLKKNLDAAITRVLYLFARAARQKAPKAMSTLVNSIGVNRQSALEGTVGPSVNYGAAVELGTGLHGPSGTSDNKMPPVQNIQDWISVVRVSSLKYADPRDLAWAIAKSIAVLGTPAQPYMAPAFEENKARAEQLLDAAILGSMAG